MKSHPPRRDHGRLERAARWSRRALTLVTGGLLLVAAFPTSLHAAPPPEGRGTNDAPASGRLTKAPELTKFVEAPYPEEERAAGRTAQVVLTLTLGADGRVRDAVVLESAGDAFDAAALTAVKQFEFSPAEVDGAPSEIVITYRYEFRLDVEPTKPTTSAFTGIVRTSSSAQGMQGVRVEVRGADGEVLASTVTGADGRFAFDVLPPGDVDVVIAGEGLPVVQTKESLIAGEALDVAYQVAPPEPPGDAEDPDDIEIVVVAPALRREVVSTAIRADEARQVPGTSGDVLRVVESMPGVGRATAGSGALVVWGAAPRDTRVYVDGVPVPRLYHEGGLRSVVHPYTVDSLELVQGGYGAAFGRGIGGMVAVTTRTPEGERTKGRIAADVLDASAVVSVPVRKKVTVLAAARVGLVGLWGRRIVGEEARDFVPIPDYGDGQFRTTFRPTSRDRVELVVLAASDRFRRGVPNPDPALALRDRRALDMQRVYAKWTHGSMDGDGVEVVPYVGYTRTATATSFGALTTSLGIDAVLAGLRVRAVKSLAPWVSVEGGIDVESESSDLRRRGSLGLPAREGDIRVFGQRPSSAIGADTWRTTAIGLAPWVQFRMQFAKGRVVLVPGVRLDPYVRTASRRNPPSATTPAVGYSREDVAVEPRIALTIRPIERLGFRFAAGSYGQFPAAEDLSATFGTPALPTARATHVVAGVDGKLTKTLSIEATAFFVRSTRLAMRVDSDSPLAARALEASGLGRTYGAQFLLRQDLARGVFGWASYTLMRSERRDRPGEGFRLSDYDQTHVLTTVLAWALPRGYEVGARFRLASGFPRTPVVGAYYDSAADAYQPVFGEHNSTRLPLFLQLDLRAGKRWEIRKTKLDVFVEVMNVWNRANAEEFAFASDYSRRDVIRGFPVLPAFGLQWEF